MLSSAAWNRTVRRSSTSRSATVKRPQSSTSCRRSRLRGSQAPSCFASWYRRIGTVSWRSVPVRAGLGSRGPAGSGAIM